MCEAVLWVKWEHRGRVCAVTPSEFIKLDPGRFRTIISRIHHVVTACREYAHSFRNWCTSQSADAPIEVWLDFDASQEMAHQAFDHIETEDVAIEHHHSPRAKFNRLWRSWSPQDFMNEA